MVTEHLQKPSREFTLPSFSSPDDVAYVEYSSDREGSMKGVCVSRQSMMSHSRALAAVMNYSEGDVMVTTLDFKKDVGLWHLLAVRFIIFLFVFRGLSDVIHFKAIYCGMRVIFVPYSLMKASPSLWLTQVAKTQTSIVLLKSRDLHWSLMAASRETKDMNLESIKSIIVADGSNPWSLSSCEQFISVFSSKGLKPNVMCPCAGSPETGTLAIRRPTFGTGSNSGHGILSMAALSHSVVRVNPENSLNSLALQVSNIIVIYCCRLGFWNCDSRWYGCCCQNDRSSKSLPNR